MRSQRSSLAPKQPKARERVGGERRMRGPVFVLTAGQLIRKCRELGHCDMCAGQVLALRGLMVEFGLTITEVADRAGVSRSMISEMLVLKKFAGTDVLDRLARAFHLPLYAFDLLAQLSLLEETSP